MALFRKFFYRKPPDGLLEISERVYVFDCCFTTDVLEEDHYKVYMGDIVSQLRVNFPDSSFMVFNFREGEHQSFLTEILSEYDMTVMDYPRQYEGCPMLTMEMIHHFLRSSESWLSLSQQNILLMHCEMGGWPVLAFMLAGLLVYRKQYTGEQKTLDMIYKQAPREVLQLLSPLNPLPSQMRYLQYISRRNVSSIWPPLDRALTLDCVILRYVPNFDGYGGCRPLFRIYGQDPFIADDRTPKVLFSTPKRSKAIQLYRQADCELVKIDIHCHIQGDVVLECISLDDDLERELMMFRVMFNTAFIRSNILMLNRDEIDIMWNAKDRFLKNFRAEVLFSEMDASNSVISLELPHIEDKDGLPIEAFAKVQEIFSNLSWMETKGDATVQVLHQISASNVSKENRPTISPQNETTEIMPQKSSPDLLKEKLLIDDAYGLIKSSPTPPLKKSISPLKHSSETSAMNQSIQLQNLALLHHSTQPKKASHCLQSSHSSPVFSRNSLQRSLTHVSRYHSAPSAMGTLGITALLHDHNAFGRSEGARSISLPPSSPTHLFGSTSAMRVTPEIGTPSPSPESQPLKLLPPPPPLPTAATNVSLLTSFPLLPSVSLPSSEIHMRNDQITPIIANSADALTAKAPSISLSTLGKTPSSLLLSSKSQSIPLPPPPTPPPPPPPLMPSSRKPSIPSLVSQKTPDITETVAPYPSISNTSFPIKGNAFLPAKFDASSPIMTTASSLVKGKASLGRVQLTATTPPPSLPHSVGISSFSLSHSTTTCVLPPPPPPLLPPPPPPPPTISLKGMPSTAPSPPQPPPPPPPPPPPSTISRKDTLSTTPSLPLPLHSTLTNIKKDTPSTVSFPPAPPSRFPSSSHPHASMVKNASAPPPPPLPSCSVQMSSVLAPPPRLPSQNPSGRNVPTVPPSPSLKGLSLSSGPPPPGAMSVLPGGIKGRNLVRSTSNSNRSLLSSAKKTSLKPLHWVKVTRAMHGSLWAETQKADEALKAPEFDMSELESLFSAAVTNSEGVSGDRSSGRSSLGQKFVRVQLIDLRRANNCEIMLTKVKIPLSDLLSSVLALDESVLDVDQADNLIKFCPNKEEMDLLKNFNGDKERLGKCEQYFLELMKVPRVESKLRVFSFKIQFRSLVADLSVNLNIVNSASQEIRNSTRLKRIMQTILSLGNALNQGTARGSAIGFRLDSLLKLTDTRARNNKMTLMHYLCKVIAEKLPELLDFPKDLVSLEVASKIQLKALAEEMQAISKGLEKVEQELITSENDGPVSETFRKTLKEFLVGAEADVRALTSLYSNVGRNADALALYFGEDPARCPFEQVINTLLNFMRLFIRAHEENCKQLELQKKKQQKEAESEKMKLSSAKRDGDISHSQSKNVRIRRLDD